MPIRLNLTYCTKYGIILVIKGYKIDLSKLIVLKMIQNY